ncbi:MAG: hypothetical protein KF878_28175 [Planctomycetes bacterium]|nr:hypothetical protein [Planctomycetota bacterium]
MRWAVALCLTLAVGPTARAQVTVDREAPVSALADDVARQAGRTLLVVGGDLDEPLAFACFDLPWREAVEALAIASGRRVRRMGEVTLLEAPSRPVTIQFTDANLGMVVALAGSYGRVGLLLADDPRWRGPGFTLDLKEVPFEDALAALRAVAPDLRVARVGEQRVAAVRPLPAVDLGRLLPELRSPPGGTPQGRLRLDPTRDLGDVCARLSVVAGVRVVADPAVRLPRPVTLHDAPWRDALEALALVCDARLVTRAGQAHLVPRPSSTLRASRAPLGAVVEALRPALGAPVTVDDPSRQVTGSLAGALPEEGLVALALATWCVPERRPDGAWRLRALPLPGRATLERAVYEPPFEPPAPRSPEGDEPRVEDVYDGPLPEVEAILQDPSGDAAVIDGRVHRPGDAVHDRAGRRREGVVFREVQEGVCVFDANGRVVVVELRAWSW